jgi:hypothetical protein
LIKASLAQDNQLKGKVQDTLEKKSLSNAVVSLLKKSDSTLVQFTRTDRNGQFQFQGVPKGHYVLLITYPKFADFSDLFEVRDSIENNIGTIPLTMKERLLQAVVIRNASSIRIKGDTTEFIADSFAVREGATVEELLRRFPGFQVNSKGEITVQGQRVQKVLVDGEEFFGDDPTMATKNISAKAVDKVQVYDSKTDQQQITGMSGEEGKTVNIKLKEDAKKGGFGKAEAGTNFNGLYDAKALYNRFSGKKKISVYSTASSTTTGSLNWDDRNKLGMDNDYEYDELSGMYSHNNEADEFSDYNFRGLPESVTAGGLYINKWNAEKESINTSYRYNRLRSISETSTFTQNILQDSVYYTNQEVKGQSRTNQHALNGKYEWKLDSLKSLKISTAGSFRQNINSRQTESQSLDENRDLVNRNTRFNGSEGEKTQVESQLQYKQLFMKKDRQLLVTLRHGLIEEDQENQLNSVVEYFERGLMVGSDSIDQKKFFNGESNTIGTRITYSEPLTDKWTLVNEYGFNQNSSVSLRNTYEKDFNGKYDVLNTVFSNNFDFKALSHTGNMILRYNTKKIRFATGAGLAAIKQRVHDRDSNNRNTYNFLRFTPQAQLSYNPKQMKNINVSYRGNTVQPTITQLQPLRENADPLNIFIGNPSLRVGFTHNLNFGYNNFRVLNQAYFSTGLRLSATSNAIANYNVVDSFGRRISTPVNVNGNRRWSYSGNYHRGQGEKKIYFNFYWTATGANHVNFVNGLENETSSFTGELHAGIGSYKEGKHYFSLQPKIGINRSRASISPDQKIQYYSYGGSMNGYISLKHGFEISNDLEVDLRQKISAFDRNINLVLWNASISKKFFKKKNGKVIIQANDILNQNKGYNRIIDTNFIVDERYLRINRYVLLKFEWTFSKMPGATNQ